MTGKPSAQHYRTFEDYLESERGSEVKHEWLDGIVYAMAGGTVEHGRLATNMTAALRAPLAGRCTVFSSDVMLFVRETNLATYPDGSVVCGAVDVQKGERGGRTIGEAVTNPSLIIEVLSDATESYDRGEKFAHYIRVVSLKEYVLVSQHERRIDVFRRPEDRGHWPHEVARGGDVVILQGVPVRVDDIYDA